MWPSIRERAGPGVLLRSRCGHTLSSRIEISAVDDLPRLWGLNASAPRHHWCMKKHACSGRVYMNVFRVRAFMHGASWRPADCSGRPHTEYTGFKWLKFTQLCTSSDFKVSLQSVDWVSLVRKDVFSGILFHKLARFSSLCLGKKIIFLSVRRYCFLVYPNLTKHIEVCKLKLTKWEKNILGYPMFWHLKYWIFFLGFSDQSELICKPCCHLFSSAHPFACCYQVEIWLAKSRAELYAYLILREITLTYNKPSRMRS